MRLSALGILPNHPIARIDNIWIDGRPFVLDEDGDTLIDVTTVETPVPRVFALGAGLEPI